MVRKSCDIDVCCLVGVASGGVLWGVASGGVLWGVASGGVLWGVASGGVWWRDEVGVSSGGMK